MWCLLIRYMRGGPLNSFRYRIEYIVFCSKKRPYARSHLVNETFGCATLNWYSNWNVLAMFVFCLCSKCVHAKCEIQNKNQQWRYRAQWVRTKFVCYQSLCPIRGRDRCSSSNWNETIRRRHTPRQSLKIHYFHIWGTLSLKLRCLKCR